MIGTHQSASGFTLTELVVVIVIATVLAAFAAARINTQSFDAEGFANEVAATLRYAQKIAISQKRNVAVGISGNTLSLTYPDAPLSGAAVRKPPGADPFIISKSGISISGTGFTFNALGKPTVPSTLTITGSDTPPTTKTITVEAETGYVRYNP